MTPRSGWFDRHIATRVVDYGWAYRLRASALRGGFDPSALRDGPGSPVLLLPGVYETWLFLRTVGEHLHREGHPVHVVPAFGRNVRPIPEMAELARRYLVDNDLADVTIVGHSKGGLIGKSLMLTPDGGERVSRMLAINSPFGGSDYAHLMPVRALREFLPTHATIRGLSAEVEVNSRIVSVFAEWDPIIPNSSVLDGAENIKLASRGHFRLLDLPELLELAGRVAAGG